MHALTLTAGRILAFAAHFAQGLTCPREQEPLSVRPDLSPSFGNHVFVDGDPVSIKLIIDGVCSPSERQLRYAVQDLQDRVIAAGEVEAFARTQSSSTADLTLPRLPNDVGWYKVSLQTRDGARAVQSEGSFAWDRGYIPYAVVPRPRSVSSENSPFGIDAALSSESRLSADQSIRVAKLAGVGWIRDRLSLARAFPDPGRRNFEPALSNAKLARESGLSVLQVFAESPSWIVEEGGGNVTNDLREAYRFGTEIGEAFDGSVGAWELWNEHDISHFGGSTPDRYAAFVKAFSLGLERSSRAKRSIGPFARDPTRGGYDEVLFAAQVSDYLDVYSFHTYDSIHNGDFEAAVQNHSRVAERGGFSGKALWITETGYGRRAFRSTESEARSASQQSAYVVKSFAIAAAGGTERVFWFVLKPFATPLGEFGLFRPDLTPLPYYQSVAVLTSMLGSARYEGGGAEGGVHVHRFSDHGREVSIAWSDHPTVLTIHGDAHVRITDAMGLARTVVPVGGTSSIPLGDSPIYLEGARLTAHTGVAKSAPPPVPQRLSRDRSVVLSVAVPADAASGQARVTTLGLPASWSPRGYFIGARERVVLTVRVLNFGDVVKACKLRFEGSEGIELEQRSATLEVPPSGAGSVSVPVAWKGGLGTMTGSLTIHGLANGTPIPGAQVKLTTRR